MRSKNCGSFLIKKDGENSSKNQRFKCKDCLRKFTFKNSNKNDILISLKRY
ncbi:transposase-like zinc-binding domain-containing protein [Campylobacter magnus]|uniref:transposase-like zinc-binding domain-containing protein n=1 Tax=Campylobacter magnus TaxID=3026462 RepID=UPI003B63E36D